MGVMSRRVLPVCGNLCFFCPSLRARSRQPVKRYKKLLATIFPRHQVNFVPFLCSFIVNPSIPHVLYIGISQWALDCTIENSLYEKMVLDLFCGLENFLSVTRVGVDGAKLLRFGTNGSRLFSQNIVSHGPFVVTLLLPLNSKADVEPNDRLISKLCEYASKNPMRIPKITEDLEHRCYKGLRNEQFGQAKVVVCIYMKLLASYQTRYDGMRILGCQVLVEFMNNQSCRAVAVVCVQVDVFMELVFGRHADYDAFVALDCISLGFHTTWTDLNVQVWFMGEYSHISMDFDDLKLTLAFGGTQIVSVTLENVEVPQITSDNTKQDVQSSHTDDHWVQEVLKVEENRSSFPDIGKKAPSLGAAVSTKAAMDATEDFSKSPSYWSKVCLRNMAVLAKEATTIRRVLEPLFRYFDSRDLWSPQNGLAFSVLSDMQLSMEKSGALTGILCLHDYFILRKASIYECGFYISRKAIYIADVTSKLAQQSKMEPSPAIVSAINDLMRHLRKCFQYSIEVSEPEDSAIEQNAALHSSLEKCIVQLANKVGDLGPILDMMAVVLENIPMTPVVARTTLSAVYHTAQLAASVPNVSYYRKPFPEALFHQLLLAMVHPDPETRVGAHRVLSAVLVPSLVCPWSVPSLSRSLKGQPACRTLSIAMSGFTSSACILEMLGKGRFSMRESGDGRDAADKGEQNYSADGEAKEGRENKNAGHPSLVQNHSIKLSPLSSTTDEKAVTESKDHLDSPILLDGLTRHEYFKELARTKSGCLLGGWVGTRPRLCKPEQHSAL
ncbi:hypothetical protein ACLOJK_011850 [Asimina triloba]